MARTEQHRARRYPFSGRIDVTEVKSDRHLLGQTHDISVYGCALRTGEELPERSNVRVAITHGQARFDALGKIVYSTSDGVMGVVFLEMDPRNQAMIDGWLAVLSKPSRGR